MAGTIPEGFEEINFKSEEAPVVAEQEGEINFPKIPEGEFSFKDKDDDEKPGEKDNDNGAEDGVEKPEEDEEDILPGQSKEANHAFREMRKAVEELKRENAELRAKGEEKERIAEEAGGKVEEDAELANLKMLQQKLKTLPRQIYDAAIEENIHDAIAKSMASNAELKLQVAIIQEQDRIKEARVKRASENIARERALNAKAEGFMRDHDKLKAKYGEVVPDLDKMDENTIERMRAGSSLYDAFVAAHEDELFAAKVKDAQRQGEVVAKSKDHLKSEKGGGSVGATKAPSDVVRLYKKFNSSWTEKQIYEMWKEDERNKRKKG